MSAGPQMIQRAGAQQIPVWYREKEGVKDNDWASWKNIHPSRPQKMSATTPLQGHGKNEPLPRGCVRECGNGRIRVRPAACTRSTPDHAPPISPFRTVACGGVTIGYLVCKIEKDVQQQEQAARRHPAGTPAAAARARARSTNGASRHDVQKQPRLYAANACTGWPGCRPAVPTPSPAKTEKKITTIEDPAKDRKDLHVNVPCTMYHACTAKSPASQRAARRARRLTSYRHPAGRPFSRRRPPGFAWRWRWPRGCASAFKIEDHCTSRHMYRSVVKEAIARSACTAKRQKGKRSTGNRPPPDVPSPCTRPKTGNIVNIIIIIITITITNTITITVTIITITIFHLPTCTTTTSSAFTPQQVAKDVQHRRRR